MEKSFTESVITSSVNFNVPWRCHKPET